MFALAIFIGIYGYLIFVLGLVSGLTKLNVFVLTFLTIFLYLKLARPKFKNPFKYLSNLDKFSKFIILIIILQAIVNLIGALGPELGFDALWYHLTFPKIYLINHAVINIPGGLLYYTGIPKLTELIYTGELALGGEVIPKLTQFIFGLLITLALYRFSRKFLDNKFSLLVALLFYSNLVVAWESTTAYIDLSRTFFEFLTFYAFYGWEIKGKNKNLYLSAVLMGLSISTKLVSVVTIPIYIVLIFLKKIKYEEKIKFGIYFTSLSLFIASPWFVFSFIHTGNPIYPLLTNYDTHQGIFLLNPIYFIKSLFSQFTNSSDPISPFYIIIFPIIIFNIKKLLNPKMRIVTIFSILSIIVWYITPQSGGGRFVMVFLPVISITTIYSITLIKNQVLRKYLIGLLIFLSIISVAFRGVANKRYVPEILGKETKADFMIKNMNFNFGDFYDTDNYFKNHLKTSDTVLLYGFHNLYFVDFNFIDSSWVQEGDMFDYIATQNTEIPKRFSFWNLIYYNPITHVRLYSVGGKQWVY